MGTYRDANNKRHGFTWRKGAFVNLFINVPGDDPVLGTVALGINDRGQIVGDYVDAKHGNRHGFLLRHGVYTAFDVPSAVITVAEGINDIGTIAGAYVDAGGVAHGFVLSEGVYTAIDEPGAASTQIFSVNNRGEIVGFYDDSSGVTHGFLGTPVHAQAEGAASATAVRHSPDRSGG